MLKVLNAFSGNLQLFTFVFFPLYFNLKGNKVAESAVGITHMLYSMIDVVFTIKIHCAHSKIRLMKMGKKRLQLRIFFFSLLINLLIIWPRKAASSHTRESKIRMFESLYLISLSICEMIDDSAWVNTGLVVDRLVWSDWFHSLVSHGGFDLFPAVLRYLPLLFSPQRDGGELMVLEA